MRWDEQITAGWRMSCCGLYDDGGAWGVGAEWRSDVTAQRANAVCRVVRAVCHCSCRLLCVHKGVPRCAAMRGMYGPHSCSVWYVSVAGLVCAECQLHRSSSR